MDIDSQDHSSERAELHFLAAMVDELMKALLQNEVMTRSQLQEIEDAGHPHRNRTTGLVNPRERRAAESGLR